LDKVLVSSSSSSSKKTQKNYNKKQQHGNGGRDSATKTTFSLLLSGLDLVDGTPILDIKPYVPHYDCVGYGDKTTIRRRRFQWEVVASNDEVQTSHHPFMEQ
jgi:hypothetical protein